MRCRATPGHLTVDTVGHEKPVANHDARKGDSRQTPLDRKGNNSCPLRKDHWGWVDVKTLHSLADNGRKSFVQVSRLGYGNWHPDQPKTRCHLLLLALSGNGRDVFWSVDDADGSRQGRGKVCRVPTCACRRSWGSCGH